MLLGERRGELALGIHRAIRLRRAPQAFPTIRTPNGMAGSSKCFRSDLLSDDPFVEPVHWAGASSIRLIGSIRADSAAVHFRDRRIAVG
jgi:hypothetical protein